MPQVIAQEKQGWQSQLSGQVVLKQVRNNTLIPRLWLDSKSAIAASKRAPKNPKPVPEKTMGTRVSNKVAHPGVPDAKATRRSSAVVQAEKKLKADNRRQEETKRKKLMRQLQEVEAKLQERQNGPSDKEEGSEEEVEEEEDSEVEDEEEGESGSAPNDQDTLERGEDEGEGEGESEGDDAAAAEGTASDGKSAKTNQVGSERMRTYHPKPTASVIQNWRKTIKGLANQKIVEHKTFAGDSKHSL